MAKIGEFNPVPAESNRIHDVVECGYRSFTVGGERILQLDTYGSTHRAKPGKVSQSIQLDEDSAEALVRIVFAAFPSVKRTVTS